MELLTSGSAGYDERRKFPADGFEHTRPAAIAVPKNASQVASIVRWANSNGLKFTVRSGGNDFSGHSSVDGVLIIDVRSLDAVAVKRDKKTATVGGGVISRDLLLALEKEGLTTPMGNTWIVGYAGWASSGGYGPTTNQFGMGLEQIVAAKPVDAKGEVVVADEEMLEAVRRMVGHLGVMTSLTIRTYPL